MLLPLQYSLKVSGPAPASATTVQPQGLPAYPRLYPYSTASSSPALPLPLPLQYSINVYPPTPASTPTVQPQGLRPCPCLCFKEP